MKKKKGISIMIGYVLLITFGIVLSVIVYGYLKSYVPKDLLKCPDDTSIFIKDYNCNGSTLNITLKNNGKFNLAGFFILATNSSSQKLATIDLSKLLVEDTSTRISGSSILLSITEVNDTNPFKSNEEQTVTFDLMGNQTYSIEITPVRYEEETNTLRFASCGNAKVKEKIVCPTEE